MTMQILRKMVEHCKKPKKGAGAPQTAFPGKKDGAPPKKSVANEGTRREGPQAISKDSHSSNHDWQIPDLERKLQKLEELDKWSVNGMKELIQEHIEGHIEENMSGNIPAHEDPKQLGCE